MSPAIVCKIFVMNEMALNINKATKLATCKQKLQACRCMCYSMGVPPLCMYAFVQA